MVKGGKSIHKKYKKYNTNNILKKRSRKKKSKNKKNIITKIGGPISIHYYKIVIGSQARKILLFGDTHTRYRHKKESNIIEITTLLKQIIRKSNSCIDFYSENAPFHSDLKAKGKSLKNYSDPLNAIRNEFGGCPLHNFKGKNCAYDNLRYHNWDLRMDGSNKNEWKTNPYDELLFKYPTSIKKLHAKFSKEDIIKYILGFLNGKKESDITEFFDKELKSKYSRKSFSDEVSVISLLEKRQKLIQKEYNKCIKSVRFPKDLLKTFIDSYISLNDTDYTLVFTDFYMLCRMFMKFDTKKSKRTPKRCPVRGKQNYAFPKNIIVYAGDSHIIDVITFLEKMYGSKPVYTTSHKFPDGISSKIITLNNIKDSSGKKLSDIKEVNDLFSDFIN